MARKKNKAMTAAEEKKFIEEVEKYKKNGQSISWATIDQKLFHRRFGSNYLYQKYNRTLKVKHFEWTRDTRIELLYYCDKYKLDESISWSNMIENEKYSVSVTQLYNQYKSIMRTNVELRDLYENMSDEEVMDVVARAKTFRMKLDGNSSNQTGSNSSSTGTSTIRSGGRKKKPPVVQEQQLLPVKKRKRVAAAAEASDQQSNKVNNNNNIKKKLKHENEEEEEYIQPKRSRQVYDDYSDQEDYSKRTKDEYRIMTRSAARAAAYKINTSSDTLDTSSSTLKDYEELEEEICSTTTDEEVSNPSQSLPTLASLAPDDDQTADEQKYQPLECLMEVCCREGRKEGLSSSTGAATVIEEYSPDQLQQSDNSFALTPLQSSDTTNNNNCSSSNNCSYQEVPTLPPISHLFEFSRDPQLFNRAQYPWYTGQYRI